MTPDGFLYQTLKGVCPGTYAAYRPGKAPSLPWFCFTRRHGEEVFADSTNYSRLPRYRVELLFKDKDPSLVESFEEALSRLGTWSLYDSDYVDSEACMLHDYRLSLSLSKMRESEG